MKQEDEDGVDSDERIEDEGEGEEKGIEILGRAKPSYGAGARPSNCK